MQKGQTLTFLLIGLFVLIAAGVAILYKVYSQKPVVVPLQTPQPVATTLSNRPISPSERELPITKIILNFSSSSWGRGNHVIKTRQEWDDFKKKASGNNLSDGISKPEEVIDFDKEMVLVVFMGPQPSGGYQIKIGKVVGKGKEVEVFVKEVNPGNCPVTLATTSPFDVVKVPKVDKEVVFKVNSEILNCDN